mgnify:CR=1 FL=1
MIVTDIGDNLVQVDYAANGIRAHENDAPESHNVNIKGYLVENMHGKKYLLATEVSSKQIENNNRLITEKKVLEIHTKILDALHKS